MLFTVNHHLAIFGDDWSSTSEDIKYLISHVTSQNQVIEVLSKLYV